MNCRMDFEQKQRSVIENLLTAEAALRGAADACPFLRRPARALLRLAKALNRPLRIAILGEPNSGKSSLANLLIGSATVPALPVRNTRLPTLLKYAPAPIAAAVDERGKRFTLSARESIPPGIISYVEVGLPSEILRLAEIMDFPGSATPQFLARGSFALKYGIDAAIWATVATQAWRESERMAWLELPQRIRWRGILSVTHCDLIAAGEDDTKWLHARLEKTAQPYFRGISFTGAGGGRPPAAAPPDHDLLHQLTHLAQEFFADRLSRTIRAASRVAEKALESCGSGP